MAQPIRLAVLSLVASSFVACGGSAPESATPSNAAGAAEATSTTTASAAAAAPVETASKPADLAALRAREVTTGLSKQPVASADGSFSAEVSASAKPTVKPDGEVLAVTIPIGTRSPVTCDVYKDRIDIAGSIARMVADVRKNVKLTSAKATDVKVAGGVPVLFVETEYTKESKDPKAAAQVGAFKIAVRAADTQTVLCSHNELGYIETFKKTALELASSMKPPKLDATYVAIDALKAGDQVLGFRETRVRPDPKDAKAKIIDVLESRLVTKGPGELSGEDDRSFAVVDKTGAVGGGRYMLMTDGEVVADVNLRRKGAKEYSYEGKQKGAPVKGTFKAQKEITTPYSRAAAVKKIQGSKDEQAAFTSYVPRVNIGAALDETYKKEGDVVVIDSGALGTAKVKVDDQGLPEKAEGTAQGQAVIVERLEVRGTP